MAAVALQQVSMEYQSNPLLEDRVPGQRVRRCIILLTVLQGNGSGAVLYSWPCSRATGQELYYTLDRAPGQRVRRSFILLTMLQVHGSGAVLDLDRSTAKRVRRCIILLTVLQGNGLGTVLYSWPCSRATGQALYLNSWKDSWENFLLFPYQDNA